VVGKLHSVEGKKGAEETLVWLQLGRDGGKGNRRLITRGKRSGNNLKKASAGEGLWGEAELKMVQI